MYTYIYIQGNVCKYSFKTLPSWLYTCTPTWIYKFSYSLSLTHTDTDTYTQTCFVACARSECAAWMRLSSSSFSSWSFSLSRRALRKSPLLFVSCSSVTENRFCSAANCFDSANCVCMRACVYVCCIGTYVGILMNTYLYTYARTYMHIPGMCAIKYVCMGTYANRSAIMYTHTYKPAHEHTHTQCQTCTNLTCLQVFVCVRHVSWCAQLYTSSFGLNCYLSFCLCGSLAQILGGEVEFSAVVARNSTRAHWRRVASVRVEAHIAWANGLPIVGWLDVRSNVLCVWRNCVFQCLLWQDAKLTHITLVVSRVHADIPTLAHLNFFDTYHSMLPIEHQRRAFNGAPTSHTWATTAANAAQIDISAHVERRLCATTSWILAAGTTARCDTLSMSRSTWSEKIREIYNRQYLLHRKRHRDRHTPRLQHHWELYAGAAQLPGALSFDDYRGPHGPTQAQANDKNAKMAREKKNEGQD